MAPKTNPHAVKSSPAGGAFEARVRVFGAWLKQSPLFRTQRRAVATLLLGIPLFLCLGSWLLGLIRFAAVASLSELRGIVHTRHDDAIQWEPAHLNQLLGREHWVRTGTNSGASLLFFDVSTVDLEEETEVNISQISQRRGGDSINVVLKIWLGETAVRAVRFLDPLSSFRVDTPTASTVVRGARFNVQVADDGATQIDIETGSAEVEVHDQVVDLAMGQRITLDPDGLYILEQVFEPDAQPVFDKVNAALAAPGNEFRLELTESEVNQFLAAMSPDPDFALRDTQIWFVDGEARLTTTVLDPIRFDLSAAVDAQVENGEIKLEMKARTAGLLLPVPASFLDSALDQVINQQEGYLVLAYDLIEFSEVQFKDETIIVIGQK